MLQRFKLIMLTKGSGTRIASVSAWAEAESVVSSLAGYCDGLLCVVDVLEAFDVRLHVSV
jgi:hypothetical protein